MTARKIGVGEPPQRLLLAMEQLLSSERSVAEFRDELLNSLYAEPASAASMRALIEEYARRGLIPQPIERLLLSDIDKVVDEEMPTTPTELTLTAGMTAGDDDEAADGFEDTHGQSRRHHTDAGQVAETPETPAQSGDARLEIGQMLRGRFEICGRAPGGSMGVVYKAIDRRLAEVGDAQAFVAIKVLAPQLAGNATGIRALQQEAARGRYLHHPNIVQFLDFDRDGEQLFLVMEWLEGRSLASVLNDRPGQPLEPVFAAKVIASVGAALEYAHGLGVTHADVKPGNVMIQPDGTIKLLDFGIARVRGRLAGTVDPGVADLLRAATPAYASPQVLSGEAARPLDDLYSLACLAYRLFSGRRVFGDKNALEAQEEGLRPARIESMSKRRWQALNNALAFNGASRQAGVRAFLDDFNGRPAAARADGFWRRHGALIGVVSMIAALFTVTMWLAGPRPPDRPPASPRPALDAAGTAGALLTGAVKAEDVSNARDAGADPMIVAGEPVAEPDGNRNEAADADSPDSAPMRIAIDEPGSGLDDALLITLGDESGSDFPDYSLTLRESEGPRVVRIVTADGWVGERAVRLFRQPVSEALTLVLPSQFDIRGDDRLIYDASTRMHEIMLENLPDDRIEPDASFAITFADEGTGAVMGRLTVLLEDDDRRAYAAAIPPDTAAFAVDAVTVRETDGAVRVPIWRLNAGNEASFARVLVTADGAMPGEDFFFDSEAVVWFEPGESDALVYVPIVRDDIAEPAESFTLEIADTIVLEGVYHRLRVTVLDDAI